MDQFMSECGFEKRSGRHEPRVRRRSVSVVCSLCFVVAERSAAIYAAMAESKYLAKLGDVKGREHILRKDRRRKRRSERLETLSRGDVRWRGVGRRRAVLLACVHFNVGPVRTDRSGPRGAVRPNGFLRNIFWRCHLGHPQRGGSSTGSHREPPQKV